METKQIQPSSLLKLDFYYLPLIYPTCRKLNLREGNLAVLRNDIALLQLYQATESKDQSCFRPSVNVKYPFACIRI